MNVRKRGKTWHMDATHPGTGKRVRFTLDYQGNKQGAQQAAYETMERLRKEALEAKDGKLPITLGHATELYCRRLEADKKASAKEARGLRGRLFGVGTKRTGQGRLDPDRMLHTLTTLDMESYVVARLTEGRAAQTVAHEVKHLRAATRYVARLGHRVPEAMTSRLIENPWSAPKVTEKTRYLSMEEFKRLYEHMDASRPVEGTRGGKALAAYIPTGKAWEARRAAQGLLVALAMTGGRWGEVKSLTWDRVDTQALMDWARGEKVTVMIRLWGNKSQKERVIGASDQICQVLHRLWEAELEQRVTNPLVFPNADGTERSGTCRAILRAMNAIGLNREDIVAEHGKATVHSLRHTFASLLIQNGADLSEVQDGLGHASLQMTRRYAHLSKGATATKLGAIMSRVAAGIGGDTTT
jgi:integrase